MCYNHIYKNNGVVTFLIIKRGLQLFYEKKRKIQIEYSMETNDLYNPSTDCSLC